VRIAVFHNQPSGGARRALSGFGRELAQRHWVEVFTLTTSDQELIRDQDWASSVRMFEFRPARSVRMGLFLNDLLQSRSLDELIRVNAGVARAIDGHDYDVVLVDACRFTYAPPVLDFLRTPAVYYCHHGPWRADDVPTSDSRTVYEEARRVVHSGFERRRLERVRAADRASVRRAALVLANSRYTAERVWRAYGVEAELCAPGIDVPGEGESLARRHVITVGALEPHKGHDLVVRAVGMLPGDLRPPLHVVANDGSRAYRRRLEALARQLGVDLSIRLRISDDELGREYAGALVFVYGARREPLGLAPLEAMARGVPVVAVYEGGVPETVLDGKTGFLTRPDPADLAERMSHLLRDAELRERMGSAARREVEATWAWPSRAKRMEQLLAHAASTPLTEAAL